MAKKAGKDEDVRPIIIKKIKKSAGGHHGGAWKVAYADFVTAMMAFFLLMWLLNVSTDDARQVIASYFDPAHPRVSESQSGAGGVMGGMSMSQEGAMIDTVQPITAPQPQTATIQGAEQTQDQLDSRQLDMASLEEAFREEEDGRFQKAKEELERTLAQHPELRDLAEHLMIDITPEGLRIQIIDQEGAPMFPSGSAQMYEKTSNLIGLATRAILDMPNEISVRGHTDSHPYPPGARYTNWELSADRANASRRVMLENGAQEQKLSNVMGKADTDHLIEDDPYDAQNRRITIMLLRETLQQAYERGALDDKITPAQAREVREEIRRQPATPTRSFQRSPGEIYFP